MIPTHNSMGWTTDILSEVSKSFVSSIADARFPVVDIGCAFGVATLAALSRGARVVAIDLEPEHLRKLVESTPKEQRLRLTTMAARFPNDIVFPNESFQAVHASNVLHFLRGSEIDRGLADIYNWLIPGGRLYVQASSPYTANFLGAIPEFLSRKAVGEIWPGEFSVAKVTCHSTVSAMPEFINLMDEEVLGRAALRAGLAVERAYSYRRAGLPKELQYDGRENVGLIALKPVSKAT